jgi:hypothetical protein
VDWSWNAKTVSVHNSQKNHLLALCSTVGFAALIEWKIVVADSYVCHSISRGYLRMKIKTE